MTNQTKREQEAIKYFERLEKLNKIKVSNNLKKLASLPLSDYKLFFNLR